MELIEIKPLKPFLGTYVCGLAEADVIDEVLVEKDGTITKQRIPRKRFVGMIPVERIASAQEVTMIEAGAAPHITVVSKTRDECHVIVNPVPATVRVPSELADSLISRGLAERATPTKRGR